MPAELYSIIWSVVGMAVTALVSWAVSLLISWLNAKIKDEKLKKWSSQVTLIVSDAVQCVFQSFVETLKNNGKFDEKAQIEAKEKALEIINSKLTKELKDYITDNFGDMKVWLSEKIESVIYQLKNK